MCWRSDPSFFLYARSYSSLTEIFLKKRFFFLFFFLAAVLVEILRTKKENEIYLSYSKNLSIFCNCCPVWRMWCNNLLKCLNLIIIFLINHVEKIHCSSNIFWAWTTINMLGKETTVQSRRSNRYEPEENIITADDSRMSLILCN